MAIFRTLQLRCLFAVTNEYVFLKGHLWRKTEIKIIGAEERGGRERIEKEKE